MYPQQNFGWVVTVPDWLLTRYTGFVNSSYYSYLTDLLTVRLGRRKCTVCSTTNSRLWYPLILMLYLTIAGGTVWCDDGLYPRKLFVSFTSGKSKWRCACFKELGWSDVRKVSILIYADDLAAGQYPLLQFSLYDGAVCSVI